MQLQEVQLSDLSPEIQKLVRESIKARDMAYCPYSKFRVGSSILTDKGEMYSGGNVETACYGLTICAERTALVKAVSEGRRKFVAVAVATDVPDDRVTPPCGSCRQFLSEFISDVPIFLTTASLSRVLSTTLSQLLPYAFTSHNVKS